MRQVLSNKKIAVLRAYILAAFIVMIFAFITPLSASAFIAAPETGGGSAASGGGNTTPAGSSTVNLGDAKGKYHCGGLGKAVETSFDIGCKGQGNPITDAAFAIIRFLSIGVGMVIVASLVYAGIQYTTSRGDPKATAEAIGRIRSNVVAFIIFIFAYAILNFLIPKGFLG